MTDESSVTPIRIDESGLAIPDDESGVSQSLVTLIISSAAISDIKVADPITVKGFSINALNGIFKAYSIDFDEETRNIMFKMVDSGVAFDPLQKADPDITLSAEEREIGGLGIFITKKTMDLVTYAYENGENILTMIKKI